MKEYEELNGENKEKAKVEEGREPMTSSTSQRMRTFFTLGQSKTKGVKSNLIGGRGVEITMTHRMQFPTYAWERCLRVRNNSKR